MSNKNGNEFNNGSKNGNGNVLKNGSNNRNGKGLNNGNGKGLNNGLNNGNGNGSRKGPNNGNEFNNGNGSRKGPNNGNEFNNGKGPNNGKNNNNVVKELNIEPLTPEEKEVISNELSNIEVIKNLQKRVKAIENKLGKVATGGQRYNPAMIQTVGMSETVRNMNGKMNGNMNEQFLNNGRDTERQMFIQEIADEIPDFATPSNFYNFNYQELIDEKLTTDHEFFSSLLWFCLQKTMIKNREVEKIMAYVDDDENPPDNQKIKGMIRMLLSDIHDGKIELVGGGRKKKSTSKKSSSKKSTKKSSSKKSTKKSSSKKA